MIFQAMFAVITPALIIGAFAERMKFSAFLIFTLLWATFVYDPVCHWVWGVGGWLHNLGALDFAGGTVVHINVGRRGAGDGAGDRPAEGIQRRRQPAAQPAADGPGRGAAVVRLVRVQRGQRAGRRRRWRSAPSWSRTPPRRRRG